MDVFKVDQNSLHYRVIKKYTTYYNEPTDICQYGRRFLVGCSCICLITALGALLLVSALDLGFWIYVCMTQTYVEPHPTALIGLTLIMIATMAGVLIWFDTKRTKRERLRYEARMNGVRLADMDIEPKVGFMTTWYRSFKGKYCIRVEVV